MRADGEVELADGQTGFNWLDVLGCGWSSHPPPCVLSASSSSQAASIIFFSIIEKFVMYDAFTSKS